jgi:hypothetical protein
MRSPFPGMDPYLEQHWRDIHARLILYAGDQLQPQLGRGLRARVEERVVVDDPSEARERGIYPDVRIVERSPHERALSGGQTTAVAEHVVIERIVESYTETFLQIIDVPSGNRVVTVIEFLSPTNKRDQHGKKEYRQKQDELAEANVTLVEIDLLRAGERVFQISEYEVPRNMRTTYAACVHRGYDKWNKFIYYALPLRERLKAINIPLRENETEAVLDLQALVDQAYTNGAYDDIDYAADPVPALSPSDAQWAQEILKAAGKR